MNGWRVSADTGGTFTDCLLENPDGTVRRMKVLSSGRLRTRVREVRGESRVLIESLQHVRSSWLVGKQVLIAGEPAGRIFSAQAGLLELERLPDGCAEGSLLEIDSGLEAPVLALQLLQPDGWGEESLSFRLGTTKGTNALLENKGAPTALFLSHGFEDLLLIRDQKRPDLFSREIRRPVPLYRCVHGLRGRLDTDGKELEPLEADQVSQAAHEALAAGCEAAAVCLLNSWRDPGHEQQVANLLKEAGFATVRSSSSVRPLIKYLDRADTTLVDTTLAPILDDYLDAVQRELGMNALWIMTSAAGLVSRKRFHAVDSLVSGPAGGVLGAVAAGRRAGIDRIISLDMGGTSTDVARWDAGRELRQKIRVGQATILTAAMPIETVAAGGGSICGFDGERLFVGPGSAGADPGPACYGAGGPLTLTDIHLLLGRLDPAAFSIPVSVEAARLAMQVVMDAAGETDLECMAEGFLEIATERMAHAIRQVTLREGADPAGYGLVAFGGAGGLQACRVAAALGMERVLFPADAGLLSAHGIRVAPRECVMEKQILIPLEEAAKMLAESFAQMKNEAVEALARDGVEGGGTDPPALSVFLRLKGQESTIPVPWKEDADLEAIFRKAFTEIFGYYPKDAELEAVKARLRLLEHVELPEPEHFPTGGREPEPVAKVAGIHHGKNCSVPVFDRETLTPGERIEGPAVVRDAFGTCFVEKGWTAVRGTAGGVDLHASPDPGASQQADRLENVERTLVLNRLEGLVEEMGDQLQHTALSTNIRERLDFSCALLDARGRLLVNAPHIPVHLGAMGMCVRRCVEELQPQPGDVVITNHPAYGGSHLPDVTLFCGLYDRKGRLLGYLANRAHHAELGGKSPGSMPADGKRLLEEGVVIPPMWLIRGGQDHFGEVLDLLRGGPFPSRAPRENRIDLEAQVASLRKGASLFAGLLEEFGVASVERHFQDLYRTGRDALDGWLGSSAFQKAEAFEELDDGHIIRVRVSREVDGMLIDFSGTSERHPGNLNATPAIVRSAVLYVLRLLVDQPMPLNEGLLDKVRIELPRCFLNPMFPAEPADCPAVVGGNVETSQRVAEALIRAFGLMAGSQGTMNNLLFGTEQFGYYETVGGGSGAGDGFSGASGVHVHMTNTAITDPEIIEHRFPVYCREFSLRRGSGGRGRFPGGDGLVRELVFREPVSLSLLSQRRRTGAPGAKGGEDGLPGGQWVITREGSRKEIPGIAQSQLQTGEGIRIETPGGGGWGSLTSQSSGELPPE